MLEAGTAGPAHRIGRYQHRGVCRFVLTAEHDAWCEHLYYGDIMKVNLINTRL